jgi:hypothetical protein
MTELLKHPCTPQAQKCHDQYLDLLLAWKSQQPGEYARFYDLITPDEQQEFSDRERQPEAERNQMRT